MRRQNANRRSTKGISPATLAVRSLLPSSTAVLPGAVASRFVGVTSASACRTSGGRAPRWATASPTRRWTSASSASTPPTARCAHGPCHVDVGVPRADDRLPAPLQPSRSSSRPPTAALELTRALVLTAHPRAAQVGRSQQGQDSLGDAPGCLHTHLIHVPG